MPRGDAFVGLKCVGNTRFPIYIRCICSNGTFNVPIDALPLQIEVGVSTTISFTFSQSFLTPAIFSLLCFCELSFQRCHKKKNANNNLTTKKK